MVGHVDIALPRRVLIIKPSALGDVVTALPVLRGLRRTFAGQVRIDWLLGTTCAQLVAEDPDLDGVVEFDRRRYGQMWYHPPAGVAFAGLCRRLRKAGYDWVIDLQGLFRSGLLAAATGAAVRAGFAASREFAAVFYNHTLSWAEMPAHTVDRNIALARSLGVDARQEDLRLFVPPAGRHWAERFARRLGGDFIVVAPATRWATKLYPTRHWRSVVAELARRVKVVLVAGADEQHHTSPLAGGENVVDLGGKTTLVQLLGLIAAAGGLISCDSAAMNIATALGVPQVTLVGPTDPARTGPYRRNEGIVQTHLPCRACLKRRCPHIACMETLAPADVLAAVERCILLPGRAGNGNENA
ncbi:MAG: glycosyltransferase family 9 protein [Planctomycetes bacterium]|nr:glycosyltransferase family 9 protein [Planctomycetota bacterium]